MPVSGKPLRFLGLVLLGWTGARIAIVWQETSPVTIATPAVRQVLAMPGASVAPPQPGPLPAFAAAVAPPDAGSYRPAVLMLPVEREADPRRIDAALLGLVRFGQPVAQAVDVPQLVPPGTLPMRQFAAPASARRSRWSGTAWLLLRPDSGGAVPGLAGSSQLGGSQFGVRLAYALGDARRVALYGRYTSAVSTPGQDAALGIDWQPTRLPIRVVAEQRFAIDANGSRGTVLGVVGGAGPTSIGHDLEVETYGQAGVIWRPDTIGFADGAVKVERRLAQIGKGDLRLGAGSWGGIQPGAARLDIGPTLGVDMPVGRLGFRMSVDWRQRVAGDARPTSGVALTIGANF